MNNAKMTKQSGTPKAAVQKRDWELINCEAIDCTMDQSKHYTAINYVGSGGVRCDIMSDTDEPVMSFSGHYSDVRKYVIAFFAEENINISIEHASYIGEQLALCDQQHELFIQD
jgi:hypothetical protein